MSLCSVAAFAEEVNNLTMNWFGTETENYLEKMAADSTFLPEFEVGETITVKGTLLEGVTADSIMMQFCDTKSWAMTGTVQKAVITGQEVVGTYVIPENTPLTNFPEGKNTSPVLRMHSLYDAGANVEFDGWNFKLKIMPVDGIYPEETLAVSDVFSVEMHHYKADGTLVKEYPGTGWVPFSSVAGEEIVVGDVLHFTGKYLTEFTTNDTTYTVTGLTGGMNYYSGATVWSPDLFNFDFSMPNPKKGNIDGIIDVKVVVPCFIPSNLLKGSADEDEEIFHPLIQVRASYASKFGIGPVIEGGKANTYANWWGYPSVAAAVPVLGNAVEEIEVVGTKDSSVFLTWKLGADAVWDIVVGEKGKVRNPLQSPFTTVRSVPAAIGGLDPTKEYELYVRSVSNPDTTNASANRTVGNYSEKLVFAFAPASIDDAEAANISMYPNPTTGLLTIAADAAYEIEVSDLSGRIVMSTSMVAATKELDLTEMNAGIYFVRFSNGEKSFTKSFVKQ